MVPVSGKYLPAVICLALAVATAAVYQQVRSNDFIDFDDPLYVTENADVQKGLTLESTKWAFTTNQAYNWHPVTWFSHILDYQLFGLKPAGHHLTNLVLHIANALLLFFVLYQMTGAIWRSAFVAALFALHPLHVESVAWVSERKDVLSTFFWLLTMWFYIHYARRPGLAGYLLVVFSFTLGLMAKQMLVTLPLVLILIDYWPVRRFLNSKLVRRSNSEGGFTILNPIIDKIPLLCLSLIACLIVLHVQSGAKLVRGTHQFPIGVRLENALLAYTGYIVKMVYPLNLGILYPHPETNIPHWRVVLAGLLLLSITIAVFHFSRERRWLLVGWLWYIGTLVPVIGLVQVGLQAMADRYTYIPLIGLFIIIAWGTFELTKELKYRNLILAVSSGIVIACLSVLTYRQVSYWKDSITLFGHTAAVTKNNDIIHNNLGRLLLERGDTDQAICHWSESLKIRPSQPTIHKGIAALYAQKGDVEKAINHVRQALIYRPTDAVAQMMLMQLQTVEAGRDANEREPSTP